jgi:hypothetical protein
MQKRYSQVSYTTITPIYMKATSKVRYIHKANSTQAILVSSKISKIIQTAVSTLYSKTINMNRIQQSRDCADLLNKYKYCQFIDIKNAFPSLQCLEVIQRSFILSRIDKKRLELLTRELFFSQVDNPYQVPYIQGTGRIGLSATMEILRLHLIESHIKAQVEDCNSLKVYIFVDDIVVFGEKKHNIELYVKNMEINLLKVGLHFHSTTSPKKNSGIISTRTLFPHPVRLGIVMRRSQNGNLIGSIRKTTLAKYKNKIFKILNKDEICDERKLNTIARKLFGEISHNNKQYPLFSTFPYHIWNDQNQRDKFLGTICKMIRKKCIQQKRSKTREIISHLKKQSARAMI